jgi:diguanylate cyclase (GGDEF)-like protein
MDRYSYLAYQNNAKVNISERVSIDTDLIYNYNSNNDTTFNKLFSYYISSIDKNDVIYTGLDNSLKTVKSGTIIYQLSKYAVVLILGIVLFSFVTYKYGKKVHIRKKIKKADKIKYMDMMTSLKNRNFLSENIPVWNQNTIYPQAIIVIDLNNIQNINDSYGYDEGDKQIKAAANVLIKTQLDNSEIMRSDGNEFTIYLVGYSEKKILSYIKKLNREFKNLPYNNGVALGFSIIEDDLKLVDDAINESTEKMKINKASIQEEKDESKN